MRFTFGGQGVKNNADAVIFYTTNCAAGITISI